MTKKEIPELIQLFTNLLWAHSPKDWVLKNIYYQKTLFISILIEISIGEPRQTIRRSFDLNIISSRSEDLCGFASDIIDEVKTEINN